MERIWLKHYPAGVPADIDVTQYSSLVELLEESFKKFADRKAFICMDKAITYRELDELSNQGAHLFRSLGLKAGDHIALLMDNRLAFMEICWAAQRSGLYYTAISRYLTEEEIAYIIKDCGAKVFITTPQCADKVKGLIKGEPGEPLFYMMDEPAAGAAACAGMAANASKKAANKTASHLVKKWGRRNECGLMGWAYMMGFSPEF